MERIPPQETAGFQRREFIQKLGVLTFAAIFGGKISDALAHGECADRNTGFVDLEKYARKQYYSAALVADPVYSTDRNFMGRPITGYESGKIELPPHVIEKLLMARDQIAMELRKILESRQTLGSRDPDSESAIFLIVKDGYRPHRATHDMVAWAKADPRRKRYLDDGWIAGGISGHNRGETIDLTLGYLDIDGKIYEVWMGSRFDEFESVSSHGNPGRELDLAQDNTWSYEQKGYRKIAGVSPAELRKILRTGMKRSGASAYEKEWWHYSYGQDGTCYDRVIR